MKQKRARYSIKLFRGITTFHTWKPWKMKNKAKGKHIPKNRAVSEGNEFEELETTSFHESTILVQRNGSPGKGEPPETIWIKQTQRIP